MIKRGAIAWMARNHVAANLLMLFLLLGGIAMMGNMKREVFPDTSSDEVLIKVSYPGASPSEVVDGVVLVIEDSVSSVEWTKKVSSTTKEGSTTITIELVDGTDRQQALQDYKAEVDRISTLPDEAEDPIISLSSRRRSVVDISLYGQMNEGQIRYYGEMLKQRLLDSSGITVVDYANDVKDFEIHVDIKEQELRKYGLTLTDVASKIASQSMNLPLGSIDTTQGELVLRLKDKRYAAEEFGNLPVISARDTGTVYLRDIAKISESFEDKDLSETFNGMPSITLRVYRVGNETPDSISADVKKVIDDAEKFMPDSVHISIWDDDSELLKNRMNLLMRNAIQGLIMVIVVLALFMELRLALWVALGIPISILGSLIILPMLGVSLNMISSFAFILVLGIVVDDAIVVGENIYAHRMQGKTRLQASIDGTREVMVSVIFSVLTTITAFVPLLFIEGRLKFLMQVMPLVVISVLVISIVESFFILPAHLNSKEKDKESIGKLDTGARKHIKKWLQWLIEVPYQTTLRRMLEYRYVNVAVFISVLIIIFSFVASGHVKFRFMPQVERDVIRTSILLPAGSPLAATERAISTVEQTARQTEKEFQEKLGDSNIIKYIITGTASTGVANVAIALKPVEERSFSTKSFEDAMRKNLPHMPWTDSVTFSSLGMSFGANINVRFSHPDEDVLHEVSEKMRDKLASYRGIVDIDDTFDRGKREMVFKVNELGKSYGLTNQEVARQVRAAFYGAEAMKFQRGLEEVTVRVQYPKSDKEDRKKLDNMFIRTSDGKEYPFYTVADVEEGSALASIVRTDRKQVVNVTAMASPPANPAEIMRDMEATILPALTQEYPGLTWAYGGEEEQKQESRKGLGKVMPLICVIMYAMLAIPFRSYIQPVIVLMAIPFGLVGAVIGHMIVGIPISMMSIFGMVAVAGVVVNDSIVMVDFINRFAGNHGHVTMDALVQAGMRRFRPILMTSLTTFFGLAPIILEKSVHAQLLIPMAVSLAFGVLFTTVIALCFVPSVYMILEDFKKLLKFKD